MVASDYKFFVPEEKVLTVILFGPKVASKITEPRVEPMVQQPVVYEVHCVCDDKA